MSNLLVTMATKQDFPKRLLLSLEIGERDHQNAIISLQKVYYFMNLINDWG